MHKHLACLSVCLLCGVWLIAQTTVTNSGFFQAGDVLRTSTDNAPNITPGSGGANQTWDFSSLNAGQVDLTNVEPASSGGAAAAFPNADIMLNAFGGELYLDVTNNEMRQLGFSGAMQGFDITAQYNPTGIYRKAPLNYGDNYTDEYALSFTIPADEIPFLDSLNLPINPDSIRLTQTFTTNVDVDGWGTLNIPNANYDVLRLRKIQTTSTKIEAYVFLWLDITDLVAGSLPGFADGAIESHEFLADGIKESIATVNLDTVGGDVRAVTFKAETGSTPVAETSSSGPVFHAYPNPAISTVRVDVRGFAPGNYDLNVYSIAGKLMLSETHRIRRDSVLTFNVRSLERGTYIYALIDADGNTVRAKRLMVVKP